jgi:microsomal dipeptidase-like Zn-dependent dipeptidase
MKIFDLHQDLMLHMLSKDKYGQSLQTDWNLLELSPIDLVIATAFPDPLSGDQTDSSTQKLITADIERYHTYLRAHKQLWQLVTTVDDLGATKKKLILHIEGLNVFDGSPEDWYQIEVWRRLGVRSVGPWWNIDNYLGGGTNSPAKGLSTLGYELIAWLESKGMIFDLAHASRQTFADTVAFSKRPLYVSHGNADTLCPSVRNYTDDQLRQIAASDGVIGVFFPATFTTGKGIPGTRADVLRHIHYIKDLIGIRHIAIGSDFGGIITGTLDGLASVNQLPNLLDDLHNAQFSDSDIEAIAFSNAARVLTAHLT